MKKFMIFSMMCLMALTSKAQVLTSATVNKVYEGVAMDSDSEFVYNAEYDGNGNITTMYVYQKRTRHKGSVDLEPLCRYQYAYTKEGLLSSRIKSVWRRGDWRQFGRHTYTLTADTYTVEFSRWNKKKADYDLPLGKMTYSLLPDESIGSIACYYRHHKNTPLELEWEAVMECRPISMDYDLTHAK